MLNCFDAYSKVIMLYLKIMFIRWAGNYARALMGVNAECWRRCDK